MAPNTTPTNQPTKSSGLSRAAIVIVAGGFGWIGGNFSTPTDTLPTKIGITAGHLMVLVTLAVLAAQLFSSRPSNRAHRGVTIVACLALASVVGHHRLRPHPPEPQRFRSAQLR